MILLLLAIAVEWFTETNSHAASARGAKGYDAKKYAEAVKGFQRAQDLKASPRNAFNLGTSQIAADQREQGSATLTEAMKDPALRPDALFNRGNSALASKAFDHAIADYIETLKLRPNHAAAKRNLEIALRRRDADQTSTSGGDQKNKPGQNQQQPKPSPAPGGDKKPQSQPDLEALLRSVQQQEQEELRRMKARSSAEARVGW